MSQQPATEPVEERLSAAVDLVAGAGHRLALTARFMERPVFMADLREAMRSAVLQSQSDWLSRDAAADWFQQKSAAVFDDLANRNLIERRYLGSKPVFRKSSIEAALVAGLLGESKCLRTATIKPKT